MDKGATYLPKFAVDKFVKNVQWLYQIYFLHKCLYRLAVEFAILTDESTEKLAVIN